MDIDLALLRTVEREKEIPFEELAEIIEQAIHSAYIKHVVNIGQPEPAADQVRVTLDRKSGEITVLAAASLTDDTEGGRP